MVAGTEVAGGFSHSWQKTKHRDNKAQCVRQLLWMPDEVEDQALNHRHTLDALQLLFEHVCQLWMHGGRDAVRLWIQPGLQGSPQVSR